MFPANCTYVGGVYAAKRGEGVHLTKGEVLLTSFEKSTSVGR